MYNPPYGGCQASLCLGFPGGRGRLLLESASGFAQAVAFAAGFHGVDAVSEPFQLSKGRLLVTIRLVRS